MSNHTISRFPSLGQERIDTTDIDAILGAACSEIAQGLNVSQVKVLQYLPQERMLLVRA